MTEKEQQYYEKLRQARQKDLLEEKVGETAGAAAEMAAKRFYGIGYIPGVKQAARKIGKTAGKQFYRRFKWVIIGAGLLIFLLVFAFFAFMIFLPIISAYAIICYNPISFILSYIPGLSGLIPCF